MSAGWAFDSSEYDRHKIEGAKHRFHRECGDALTAIRLRVTNITSEFAFDPAVGGECLLVWLDIASEYDPEAVFNALTPVVESYR